MAIRIPEEDWSQTLEEKYTVQPEADFSGNMPIPREIFYFFEKEVAVPFAEWSKFYDEFPNSFTSKSLKEDARYFGELRDYQNDIYQEALQKIKEKHYVFLHLSTAVGKTFLSIYLAFNLGKKIMMSTYRTKLFSQWLESIQKFSNLNAQHIKSSRSKIDPTADFWLVSPEILKKVPEDIKKQVGTLILDEVHDLVTPTRLDILLTLEPDYLICLTATHDRSDGMEKALFLMCGPEEEFVDRFTIVDNLKLYRVDTGIKGRYLLNPITGKLDWLEMVTSIVTQQKRIDTIIKIIQRHPDQRIMLIAVYNMQFKAIEKELDKLSISYSQMYDKYKPKNKNSNVLLAQTKQAGVGFDDTSLEVLVLLDSMTDVRQVSGRVGRGIGSVPVIYDLVDDTNVHRNHWKKRKEWYRKRTGSAEGDESFYQVFKFDSDSDSKELKEEKKKLSLVQSKLAKKK